MRVPEIDKATMVPCPQVCKGGGCGIYETRPGSCKSFECIWLQDTRDILQEDDRPDSLGLMFSVMFKTAFGDVLTAWNVHPGQPLTERATRIIERVAEKQVLLIIDGNRRSVVGPPRELPRIRAIMDERKAWASKQPGGERRSGGKELFPKKRS
jgi:hypothetical protein